MSQAMTQNWGGIAVADLDWVSLGGIFWYFSIETEARLSDYALSFHSMNSEVKSAIICEFNLQQIFRSRNRIERWKKNQQKKMKHVLERNRRVQIYFLSPFRKKKFHPESE